jgi:MATE family multidrug resistance protein
LVAEALGSVRKRWSMEGGYRDVLVVATPLILSTGAWSVQHFVDRMFLTWYSPETIAAAMPAGMVNFTIMSFFLGTARYASTFAAQYYGAEQYRRIGPALWQGVYVALFAGLAHLILIPLAKPIFDFAGHDPQVRAHEITYFRGLCLGAGPAVGAAALSGFFAGRGKTWPIMWVNVLATAVNLILDYALIFGHWGFPELGIKGAAIATVLSACFSFVAYLFMLSRPVHDERYHTLRGWRFEGALFGRLMRFGLPSGIQFCLDMAGFTAFVLLMGRLGTTSLAATNIAFNINTLAFMPMIGFGIAVSVLVGQQLGKDKPALAQRSAYSGFHLTFIYMASIAAAYVLVPGLFLRPFAAQADPQTFEPVRRIAVTLLRFVAVYSLFDTMNIIFASAIKGAGDTRYVMFMIVIVSFLGLVAPSYVALVVLGGGVYVGWTIASIYISVLGLAFLRRFLGGKWKSMRVIEEAAPSLPTSFPAAPTTESLCGGEPREPAGE